MLHRNGDFQVEYSNRDVLSVHDCCKCTLNESQCEQNTLYMFRFG